MLPVSVTIVAASGFQSGHGKALAEGLQRSGIKPILQNRLTLPRTKHVACWGWKLGKKLRSLGLEVLVMERGYLGDRFSWTSLGWNGLNGRARFSPKDDPSRFDTHFRHLLKPWKDGGDYVLLIGQVPGDASLGGMDLTVWYRDTAETASRAYGLPVRFRPHPQAIKRGHIHTVNGAKTIGGPLEDCLEKAAVVVTFNSNTSVDSVLAGVPTVTLDRGSMAWEMCGHEIGERVTPDRELWAARLAWCQWSLDEIKSGAAFETTTDVFWPTSLAGPPRVATVHSSVAVGKGNFIRGDWRP